MKRLLKALIPVCMFLFAAPVVAGAQGAQDVVMSTTDQVLKALRDEGVRQDRQRVFALIEQVVLPHFDFAKMSQWVLGRHWKGASAEEQGRFVEEFRKLLVRTYSTALMEYTNEQVVFLPFHAEEGSDTVTVKTQVNRESGPAVPIDYRLYLKEGEWKVFDVAVDGISLVTNYRNTFNEEINAKGLTGLIDNLTVRNQQ